MAATLKIILNEKSILHNTSVRKTSPAWIVIHYTATNNATAANEIAYFSKATTTNASSDFFVDFDGVVYQYNKDLTTRYCWAVGGKKLKNTAGGSMHGIVMNNNSVSIEMCCKLIDGKWYITEDTYNATIELARYLRKQFNIPSGHTVRHYDVTGKMCPNIVGFIIPDTRWQEMKTAIDTDDHVVTATTQVATQTVVKRFNLSVDGSLGTESIKALQAYLGTVQDGIISGQHKANRKYLIACPSNWRFTAAHTGSKCIRALQTKLGVISDGLCGKDTIKALQKRLCVSVDGYLGKETAKALQRYLNSV